MYTQHEYYNIKCECEFVCMCVYACLFLAVANSTQQPKYNIIGNGITRFKQTFQQAMQAKKKKSVENVNQIKVFAFVMYACL